MKYFGENTEILYFLMIFTMISLLVAYVAFPESADAILAKSSVGSINIETSGNLGLHYDGKCQKTYPNSTLVSDEYQEWCSNVAKDEKDPSQNPFIQYSVKEKQLKVYRYSVRNGCCYYACCCDDENGKTIDYQCCCYLYSYSLQASNDNKTWTVLHKVEKDKNFNFCETKTFDLKEYSAPYKYFRFVLDENWPNCQKCMQVNQIELYGEAITAGYERYDESVEEDESISIIGRVKKYDH